MSGVDFERLKKSIKDEGGLLMPIVLNQDRVVLDGHHRLRACRELGIPIVYTIKDFTNRPLEELKFVVSVNLHRRHLDEFQRAEIGLKMRAIAQRIAAKHHQATLFTKETSRRANDIKYGRQQPVEEEEEEEEDAGTGSPAPPGSSSGGGGDVPSVSGETSGNNSEFDRAEEALRKAKEKDLDLAKDSGRTREQLASFVGVSPATIARVETILDEGTEEIVGQLRDRDPTKSKRPGVRTAYEKVQAGKVKSKLSAASGTATNPKVTAPSGTVAPPITVDAPLTPSATATTTTTKKKSHYNEQDLVTINKDFRLVTSQDIPDNSIDLVLVMDFPEPKMNEDAPGRIHEQLMDSAQAWLKDGGVLCMYVPQPYIPRAICQRPSSMWFSYIIAFLDPSGFYPTTMDRGVGWRPYCVYVKGPRGVSANQPQVVGTDLVDSGNYNKMRDLLTTFIKQLSPATNASVVDPFMGLYEGAMGSAVLHSGRKYYGIEPDGSSYVTALDKLHDV